MSSLRQRLRLALAVLRGDGVLTGLLITETTELLPDPHPNVVLFSGFRVEPLDPTAGLRISHVHFHGGDR